MKSIIHLITRAGRTGAIAALVGSLSFASPAFAGKGGKGGGKPGGGDPPAEPPPFYYQVNWIGDETEENHYSYYRLGDVTTDGTAVGQFWPMNDYGDRYAVAVFPNGEVINLESLLIDGGCITADTRVTLAVRISDGLLIALDVWDSAAFLHTGALQLNPDGTIAAFAVFSDPAGESAILTDASESGEFLIGATENTNAQQTGGIYFGNPATMYVWSPMVGPPMPGTSLTLLGQVGGGSGGWFYTEISDYPAALIEGAFVEYNTTGATTTTTLPDPGTTVSLLDLGDDGTVVANIQGALIKRNRREPSVLARWVPGALEWETLSSAVNSAHVNESGEIAMSAGGDLSVFHDDYGLQAVNDLIDPAQAGSWNANGTHVLKGFSDPLPGDPFGGVILGTDGGAPFTLTPVDAP